MAAVDPGAIYNTTLADLGLQSGNELATIGENEGFLKTNVGNAENSLTQQEPGVYTGESNRANKGGILNSGINTQRKGTIASSFAGKRTANAARLSQGLTTYNKARETVKLKQTEGEHTAAANRAANEDALQAANPTIAPAAAAAPAAPEIKWSRNPAVREQQAQGVPRIGSSTPQPTTGGARGPIKWSRDPRVRAEQARRGY